MKKIKVLTTCLLFLFSSILGLAQQIDSITSKDSVIIKHPNIDSLSIQTIDTSSIIKELQTKRQYDILILENIKIKKEFYGIASFYHNMFEGRLTSNGEIFSQKKLTCAHKTLPHNTFLRITNLGNDKTVIVKVNDRLPPNSKRTVDLTYRAAKQLDFIKKGLAKVKIEILDYSQFELIKTKKKK